MSDAAIELVELDPQSAIEQWCDQELVAEERRLRESGYSGQTFASIVGKEDATERANDPLCRVVDQLRTELQYKLLDGDLLGAGYVSGDMPDQPRRDVQPNRWSVLRIDFENWSAEGSGIVLNDLRIRERVDVGTTSSNSAESGEQGLLPELATPVIRIIQSQYEVRAGSRRCLVPQRAFRLLLALAERVSGGRKPLSTSEIRNLFLSAPAPEAATYEIVKQLRHSLDKLGKGEGHRLIRTVHNTGFTLALEQNQFVLE